MELKKIIPNTTSRPKHNYFWHDLKVMFATIVALALFALVTCGVFYITNFEFSIKPRVTYVTPIGR